MVNLFRDDIMKWIFGILIWITLVHVPLHAKNSSMGNPPLNNKPMQKYQAPQGKMNPSVISLPVSNKLTIKDVIMQETPSGGIFSIKFTVQEPGKCTIGSVVPEVVLKSESGKTEILADRLSDVYSSLGVIRLICNELEGGKGNYEYSCRFSDDKISKWIQLGISLEIESFDENNVRTTKKEYTWFDLDTRPYYYIKQ
jgi:hypothetical protein